MRINVTRAHRQTIQYILPQHAERATQAELLVIDEAARDSVADGAEPPSGPISSSCVPR